MKCKALWGLGGLMFGIADATDMPVLAGDATPAFVETATGESGFGVPAVLFFDASGCLVWSDFGLRQEDEALDRLGTIATLEPGDCDRRTAAPVLDNLAAQGVQFRRSDVLGKPLVIWYGSDTLCPPCVDKKQRLWSRIRSALPAQTLAFDLNWK